MRSRSWLLHRAAVAAAVIAVAALGMTGCSMVGPESSWTGNEGSVSGVVRSTGGYALAGIDVRMCAQTGSGECLDYMTTTGAGGCYSVESLELGDVHAYSMDYVVYVNRTPSSALPIVAGYGTHVATVNVTAAGSAYDVTIQAQAPGVPEDYIE